MKFDQYNEPRYDMESMETASDRVLDRIILAIALVVIVAMALGAI